MKEAQPTDRPNARASGTVGRDLLASVVVFLVALPLCMGIAIASGVPPALGLISGMIGGIVVGSLAGSPLQVSGPAAGLAVLVYQLVQTEGMAALGIVVLGAGLLQLACGALRLGRWFRAVSPAVIQGMLAGIGVLIFASQFHVMVDDSPRSSGILNLISIPEAIVKGVIPQAGTAHHIAAAIGLSTITVIVLWNKFRPTKVKMIPGSLVAVVGATIIAILFAAPIEYVNVPANLTDSFTFPTLATLDLLAKPSIWVNMFAFGVIASAETLLCATAVDRTHDGPRTNYDKELFAQGVGNSISGLLGALPVTGVIVRSSANVEAGAKTRLSAIVHGFWLLGLIVLLPHVIALVPKAALAAILVYTGVKLVNPKAIAALWRFGRAELVIYLGTVVGIVATDLLTGVGIGLGLALLRVLYTFLRLEIRQERSPGRVDVTLVGSATFVQLPRLAGVIESVEPDSELHLHIAGLAYADHATMELLTDWEKRHPGRVVIEWDELEAKRKASLIVGSPTSAAWNGQRSEAPAASPVAWSGQPTSSATK